MTLPIERTNAVLNTQQRILELAPYIHGEGESVRIPREQLRQLLRGLKHYPSKLDMNEAANLAPEIFGGGDGARVVAANAAMTALIMTGERECCGTFPKTPHRASCAKFRAGTAA